VELFVSIGQPFTLLAVPSGPLAGNAAPETSRQDMGSQGSISDKLSLRRNGQLIVFRVQEASLGLTLLKQAYACPRIVFQQSLGFWQQRQ
jgi:hypothetical protein